MAQPTSEMAFEAWKQADARARDYEARLAQAWKAYDQLGAPSPDAQLVAEVALFREVAQRRLSELLQVMKASNAGPDLLLGPGGEARAA